MAQSKQGTDSLGRKWKVSIVDGEPTLTPIGHDTDPDGPGLSLADWQKLLDLLPAELDEGDEDHLGHLYDTARARCIDAQMGL